MSLENLQRVGQLEQHETDAVQVNRMLGSADRNLLDARQKNISLENRLDIAYRAIMQLAMVALWANGYRPATNRPGHHQTMIQSLVNSTGLDSDDMLVLNSFRGRRNAIDYTGEGVDEGNRLAVNGVSYNKKNNNKNGTISCAHQRFYSRCAPRGSG